MGLCRWQKLSSKERERQNHAWYMPIISVAPMSRKRTSREFELRFSAHGTMFLHLIFLQFTLIKHLHNSTSGWNFDCWWCTAKVYRSKFVRQYILLVATCDHVKSEILHKQRKTNQDLLSCDTCNQYSASFQDKMSSGPSDMCLHPSIQEAEESGPLWVPRKIGLHSTYQASQRYIMRSHLKKN